MNKRFLDDLPDLWKGEYSRRRGIIRRKSTSAKSYLPKPVNCPAARQKLVRALMNNGTRQKWQAGFTRVFQENRSYDQQWANDPNNPFPVGWLKNGLPRAIKRSQFDKVSEQEYDVWCRIVKERTGFNIAQGTDKTLEIFNEKQAEYIKGHRTFYIWEAEKVSKIFDDEDLLCCILAIYYDHIEVTPKVVTDKIRNIDPDTYEHLKNFTGQLDQGKLETLLVYAEAKKLLEPVSKLEKPAVRRKSKSRKKTPPQLLRETRERQATLELAKNLNITAEKLGKILGCNKSTVTRLKAWQNKGILDYDKPPNGYKLASDKDGPDIEAIDKSQ